MAILLFTSVRIRSRNLFARVSFVLPRFCPVSAYPLPSLCLCLSFWPSFLRFVTVQLLVPQARVSTYGLLLFCVCYGLLLRIHGVLAGSDCSGLKPVGEQKRRFARSFGVQSESASQKTLSRCSPRRATVEGRPHTRRTKEEGRKEQLVSPKKEHSKQSDRVLRRSTRAGRSREVINHAC